MSYWLLKTEPSVYSYGDLVRDGITVWDGITNNLALKHIRSMKKGDRAFVYHSGDEKAIIGISEIASNPYADPKQRDSKLVVVDLKPKRYLKNKITLAQIKSQKKFASFELVRISRLSVMPVKDEWWSDLVRFATT